jgi:hypothetical protein
LEKKPQDLQYKPIGIQIVAYATYRTVRYLVCFELSGYVEAGGLLDDILQVTGRCGWQIYTEGARLSSIIPITLKNRVV